MDSNILEEKTEVEIHILGAVCNRLLFGLDIEGLKAVSMWLFQWLIFISSACVHKCNLAINCIRAHLIYLFTLWNSRRWNHWSDVFGSLCICGRRAFAQSPCIFHFAFSVCTFGQSTWSEKLNFLLPSNFRLGYCIENTISTSNDGKALPTSLTLTFKFNGHELNVNIVIDTHSAIIRLNMAEAIPKYDQYRVISYIIRKCVACESEQKRIWTLLYREY